MWSGASAVVQEVVGGSRGTANAATLEREIAWFEEVLDARICKYFEQEDAPSTIWPYVPPGLDSDPSPYAVFVRQHGFGFHERLTLILTVLPHIRPQVLDTFFIKNKNFDRGFTEFGGLTATNHGGFLPTGETLAFILAGDDIGGRFAVGALFDEGHPFSRHSIVTLEERVKGEPHFSGALRISPEYLSLMTTGEAFRPSFSNAFPANRLTTKLAWDDLVLSLDVLEEIEHICTWMKMSGHILNNFGLGKALKPGYRALFYGPPGTGKTLTATLIGQKLGADVYRIDLASVVSKYIGETEKNLSGVFDHAEKRDWILFFDEADALFGKRTQTSSSNDRYANQEVSYLLQRVEDFPGTVILASNLRANIDEAFSRRFQSLIFFPMPDSGERSRLWTSVLGENCPLDSDVDINALAEQYELSGGAITNVVRYGVVRALRIGRAAVTRADFIAGINRELRKEGKTI